ncbi:sugar transferase [Chitinophaga lutea]
METITPELLTLNTYLERNEVAPQPIQPIDRIVLCVCGQREDFPESGDYFNYMVANGVMEAEWLIDQLLNVHRRVPAAIVLATGASFEQDLAFWAAYFHRNQTLRSIPFFIYANRSLDALRPIVKKHSFVDDILTINCWNNLKGKTDFVARFKQLNTFAGRKQPLARNKRKFGDLCKRAFDISVASTLLLLASPVLAAIAVAVKATSRGPVFYAGLRAGRNYKVFKFYKFRTMVANADKQLAQIQHLNQYSDAGSGPMFIKVSNDPRVTPIGKFLRNTSLDEIPQLLNVLKGDMSLVGNRPLPLYEATTLTTDEWAERFLAPAGITGLWQVSKRGKKDMSVQERIDLDINYAKQYSFRMDMWLMMSTPFALIQKDNV